MYSYIKGELSEIVAENHIVVENGGIGYNIYIPGQVLSLLPGVGEEVKIYTYLCVREDAFILYGFLTRDDLNVFKLLIGVSGIGPKGALAILLSCQRMICVLQYCLMMQKHCKSSGCWK